MEKMRLIGPFNQLIPMTGIGLKGAVSDTEIQIIPDGGILIQDSLIKQIGDFEALKKQFPEAENTSLKGNHVCVPGFVDAHTHICFGGSRAKDYAMRNAGKSYLEIAKAGGGIWDTVTQTRKASQEELTKSTIKLANRHLKNGTTTIEVKSGYGLTVQEELKMLRAINAANTEALADLIPTCLAAHMLPKDFEGFRDRLFKRNKLETFSDSAKRTINKSYRRFYRRKCLFRSTNPSLFYKGQGDEI